MCIFFFTYICILFEYQQVCLVKCLWVIQYPIQTAYSVKNCGEFERFLNGLSYWFIIASHTYSQSEFSFLRLNSLSECVSVSQPFIHSPGSSFIWTTLWQFSSETEGFLKPEVIWLGEPNPEELAAGPVCAVMFVIIRITVHYMSVEKTCFTSPQKKRMKRKYFYWFI